MTVIDGYAIKELPPDFDGPICATCRHCEAPKVTITIGNTTRRTDESVADTSQWQCSANYRIVGKPAHRNPITGVVTDVTYSVSRCVDHNYQGTCRLYELTV